MNYEEMSNSELADLCRERGLTVRSGNNYHGRLVAALVKYDESVEGTEDVEVVDIVEEVLEEDVEEDVEEVLVEEEPVEDVVDDDVQDEAADEPVERIVTADTVYTEFLKPERPERMRNQVYTY